MLGPLKTWNFVLAAILVTAAAWPEFTAIADETVRIERRENWSAVFSGTEQKFTFDITSDESLNGRMTWTHSAGQRTMSRGEVPVKGKSDTVSVKLRIPPVKEGVVLDTQLTLAVIQDGDREPVASLSKPLWLYAKNPFVDRTEWLDELKITLYDPTDDEKTTDIFDGAEIPYKTVRNVGAIESLEEGMLVVAEGVSLEDHRGLGSAMTAVAGVLQKRHGWKAGIPAYLLATYVAVTRIKTQKHFASDVLAGATLGTLIGINFVPSRNPTKAFGVMPLINRKYAGIHTEVRF